MGRGEPGFGPGLTTQSAYFRQEMPLRQPLARAPLMMSIRLLPLS
jgi:hypothetical protein